MRNHYYKVEFFRVVGCGIVSTFTRYLCVKESNMRIAFEVARKRCERHELTVSGWGYGVTVIEWDDYLANCEAVPY